MSKSYSVVKAQISARKSLVCALAAALIAVGSLAACKPNVPVANEAVEIKAVKDIPVSTASSTPAALAQTATPLANVMAVFISETPATWNAFDPVADIKWRDAAPVSSAGKNMKNAARTRSGTLLLQGFGEISMPDGKVGVEAGIKSENEGLSGLSLSGSNAEVETLTLRKFRPNDNYAEVISRQFPDDAELTLIADNCADEYSHAVENDRNNKFFKLSLSKNSTVYMEGSVDKDGGNSGPGYTNYIFYRAEPIERINKMKCHQM